MKENRCDEFAANTVRVLLAERLAPLESVMLTLKVSMPTSFASAGREKPALPCTCELETSFCKIMLPVFVLLTMKLYAYGAVPPVIAAVSVSLWPCVAVEFEAVR